MRGSLSDGAGYLMQGVRLLGHPRLRPFVIIPLLINIVIFGGLVFTTISYFSALLEGWMQAVPDWLTWLEWLLWPLLVISLGLLTGYLFTGVAILIASPFNGLLAEKAEELITGEPVAGPETIAQAFMIFPRSLGRELVKFAYYLPLLLVVFVLSWIPPISAVAPALWFLFGAWMMAVQYVDYPTDNNRISFAAMKQLLRERRLSSLGFGATVALASSIPVVNFIVVPAAVCGATLFWCRELRRTQ